MRFKKDQRVALYFTTSDIVHVKFTGQTVFFASYQDFRRYLQNSLFFQKYLCLFWRGKTHIISLQLPSFNLKSSNLKYKTASSTAGFPWIFFCCNQLKSVHFKKTVSWSSFLSKLWYFSIQIKTKSADAILKSTIVLKEMRCS